MATDKERVGIMTLEILLRNIRRLKAAKVVKEYKNMQLKGIKQTVTTLNKYVYPSTMTLSKALIWSNIKKELGVQK